MAKSCGVDSTVPASLPAVALGAGAQCTPMEIAVAYATIAAGGVYSKPHLITKVKDASGKLLYRNVGTAEKRSREKRGGQTERLPPRWCRGCRLGCRHSCARGDGRHE